MVIVPASVTAPMVHVRDEAGQLRQLQEVCAALGPDGAVVEVDRSAGDGYGQSIRSYCGVPTISLVRATPARLATISSTVAAHGRVLFVLSQDPTRTRYADGDAVVPFSSVTVERWPNVINSPPTDPSYQTTVLFLATVDRAGLAHSVPPPR